MVTRNGFNISSAEDECQLNSPSFPASTKQRSRVTDRRLASVPEARRRYIYAKLRFRDTLEQPSEPLGDRNIR